jgi:hypothetical protein
MRARLSETDFILVYLRSQAELTAHATKQTPHCISRAGNQSPEASLHVGLSIETTHMGHGSGPYGIGRVPFFRLRTQSFLALLRATFALTGFQIFFCLNNSTNAENRKSGDIFSSSSVLPSNLNCYRYRIFCYV